ncbi:related to chitin binding protein [Phialocephala subalpina]|uniref:Related to chitin binding protein n=1 Tax=Phialocephala subalpina TaxID=576137 RepID=A0A1L7WPN9_9HELO|nr:related to chitin binding protein [Phialocephala subalpina]
MYIFACLQALLFFFSSSILVHAHDSGFDISPSLSGAEINIRFGEEAQDGHERNHGLEKRQACGSGVGSCPTGQCCSSGGQCGTGPTFCNGPACQLAYGPACDGNISPPGSNTLNVARTKVGNVAYGGAGLYHCSTAGTIALTFDDGPYTYTQSVLDTLAKYNVQATFFINGNSLGKGRIDDPLTPWPQVLRNMYNAGHQLASHTWTHQDLTILPMNLMQNQVIYNEMAFRNIFGFFPTYIRPPFGYCSGSSGCADYLNNLGYHIVYWDVDTKDYLNDDPDLILNSENYFAGNVSSSANGHSYIPLAHDIHQNTALTLVAYMLDMLKARGYKPVTVGEYMGDPRANCYKYKLKQECKLGHSLESSGFECYSYNNDSTRNGECYDSVIDYVEHLEIRW